MKVVDAGAKCHCGANRFREKVDGRRTVFLSRLRLVVLKIRDSNSAKSTIDESRLWNGSCFG